MWKAGLNDSTNSQRTHGQNELITHKYIRRTTRTKQTHDLTSTLDTQLETELDWDRGMTSDTSALSEKHELQRSGKQHLATDQ